MKKIFMIAVVGVTIISQSVFARSIVGEDYEATLKYQIQLQKAEIDSLSAQVQTVKEQIQQKMTALEMGR